MRKKVGLIVGSLVLALGIGGCSSNQQQQQAGNTTDKTPAANTTQDSQKIELKFGYSLSTDNPRHLAATKFAELVKEKTKGKVEVKQFPNEILGSEAQMADAVKLGTLDITATDPGVHAAIAPKLPLIGLPYLVKDYATAYKVLDGPIGQEMAEPLEKNNMHLLVYWENGFREMTNSKRPINSPADLKGLKMRVPESPIAIATFKAMGTNPTPMAFGQLYTSLQSQVVDGEENPLPNIYNAKFYEVQKYLTMSNHQYGSLPMVINKTKWSSLSPDIQKAIQEAAVESRDFLRKTVQDQDKDLLQKLKDKGMEVTTPDTSAFRETSMTAYKEFEAKVGADFMNRLIEASK